MDKRFIECKGCKKKACIIYKQVINEQIQELEACEDCPELAKRLYANRALEDLEAEKQYESICCENCHTKGSDLLNGSALGCSICYQTFQDLILKKLKKEGSIPHPVYAIFSNSHDHSLHVGLNPFHASDQLSSRLSNLNAALNEALKIENYEQAAWIRDRIKTLTEGAGNGQSNHN
ncbi:MAG: UvrB/UvrC motif-containing protein [Chlamydiales bacterium]|nr:UvrB/UvrC motif-containing protein [Chlamydiales bacterium]